MRALQDEAGSGAGWMETSADGKGDGRASYGDAIVSIMASASASAEGEWTCTAGKGCFACPDRHKDKRSFAKLLLTGSGT